MSEARKRANGAARSRARRSSPSAAEEDGKGIGRIRLRRIADVSAESLLPFVREAVVPGTHVHTDGWKGYAGLGKAGFKHRVSVISASPDPAHVVMPRVHRVAALLKRWLLGTHQGGVKAHQLDYYLDEFTFRFNRRRSKARGLLFHRLAEQAVAVASGALPHHHWKTRKSERFRRGGSLKGISHIANNGVRTALAARDVATERRRPAGLDRGDRSQLAEADVPFVGCAPRGSMGAEYVRHLHGALLSRDGCGSRPANLPDRNSYPVTEPLDPGSLSVAISSFGTELPTFALQRFRPELGGSTDVGWV